MSSMSEIESDGRDQHNAYYADRLEKEMVEAARKIVAEFDRDGLTTTHGLARLESTVKAVRDWIEATEIGAPMIEAPAIEGPFTYPSGWRGYYDPSAGLYLGIDDTYMPRDFDPSQS